jgi:hypothetical protein
MSQKDIVKKLLKVAEKQQQMIKKLAQRPLEVRSLSEDPVMAPMAGKLKEYQKQMLITAGIGAKYDVIIYDIPGATQSLNKKIEFLFSFDHKINDMFKKKLIDAFNAKRLEIQKQVISTCKLETAQIVLNIKEA